MALKIHKFESTGDAYDACQCDENISTGDILIIENEQVVGIADTWPVAVTQRHESLHGVLDTFDWDQYPHSNLAFSIADAYGWPLNTARQLEAPPEAIYICEKCFKSQIELIPVDQEGFQTDGQACKFVCKDCCR